MHPRIQRKLFGFSLLGATAAAIAGGLHIGKRQRLNTYYRAFCAAINRAVGHYKGSVHGAALALESSMRLEEEFDYSIIADLVRERPPVDLDDQLELHCDITASLAPTTDLEFLYFAVDGPTDVVAYLCERLRSEIDLDLTVTNSEKGATITVCVFEKGDPEVDRVSTVVTI